MALKQRVRVPRERSAHVDAKLRRYMGNAYPEDNPMPRSDQAGSEGQCLFEGSMFGPATGLAVGFPRFAGQLPYTA